MLPFPTSTEEAYSKNTNIVTKKSSWLHQAHMSEIGGYPPPLLSGLFQRVYETTGTHQVFWTFGYIPLRTTPAAAENQTYTLTPLDFPQTTNYPADEYASDLPIPKHHLRLNQMAGQNMFCFFSTRHMSTCNFVSRCGAGLLSLNPKSQPYNKSTCSLKPQKSSDPSDVL